jgi:hypothetical protein
MSVPASLAIGDHVLFADPAVYWEAAVPDTAPSSVVLTASIQIGANPQTLPTQARTATTVAIQMNSQVALQLYGRLYELVRSMGWLPEE